MDPALEFTANLVVGHLAERHFRETVTVGTAEEKHLAETLLKLLRAGV